MHSCVAPSLQVWVRGGACLPTKPGRVGESVPYLAPVVEREEGVSKVLFWEGGGRSGVAWDLGK